MKPIIYICLAAIISWGLYSCQKNANSKPLAVETNNESTEDHRSNFNQYWYQGKAEVAAYKLEQSRYGEIHTGKAVLIFVTEDFSKEKQVKLDYPGKAGKDKVSVMKMNFIKKFNTGLYPYSMMLSVFTPTDQYHHPNTLKTTMSSQEWCGHVFSQANLKNDHYEVSAYSYFEQEGDVSFKLDKLPLEDEIWTLARLNYKKLPTGKFKILPGLFYTRMNHFGLKPVNAEATLTEQKEKIVYELKYPERKRSLSITLQKEFPHRITAWEETAPGITGKTLTTKAVLDKTLFTDYWTKNRNKHAYLRDSLNLSF